MTIHCHNTTGLQHLFEQRCCTQPCCMLLCTRQGTVLQHCASGRRSGSRLQHADVFFTCLEGVNAVQMLTHCH